MVDIKELTFAYDAIDFDKIDEAIASNFRDFNPVNYKRTVTSTSEDNMSYVVDYTLMYGDYATSSGYTLIFKDNVVSAIYDNNIISSSQKPSQEPLTITNIQTQVNEALLEAERIVDSMASGNIIVSQTWEPFFDIESGMTYIKVFTKYDYMGTGCYGAVFHLYLVG